MKCYICYQIGVLKLHGDEKFRVSSMNSVTRLLLELLLVLLALVARYEHQINGRLSDSTIQLATQHHSVSSAHVLRPKGLIPISLTVNHTSLNHSLFPGCVGCTKMRCQPESITRALQEKGNDASVHVLC